MKVIFTIILYSLCLLPVNCRSQAQNFIGMHKDQIMQVMKETQKSFKLNTDAINVHYNYLKYENKISDITLLFFLSDTDRCTLIRQMCDYSNINDIVLELNTKYRPVAKNIWEYGSEGKTYSVVLTEEDWFFTVTTRLKEK